LHPGPHAVARQVLHPHGEGAAGACVEVGTAGRAVAVRDSKDPDGPSLAFAPDTWQAFAEQVKAGA
jgi:hypothetical protein